MTSPTVNNFKIKMQRKIRWILYKKNNLDTNNISLYFKPNVSAQLILYIKLFNEIYYK